jgi:2-dehydropantoate 2-reductase
MLIGNPKPTIAIMGAGALGGYYGCRLAQHGNDVHFLLRSDYDLVRKQGWKIRSVDGDFELPPEALHVYDNPDAMPKADLAVVTLKTTANSALGNLISPVLKADTIILTLQNGLGNEQLLGEQFGMERVLGGMAFVCINRLADGVIHHMDHGVIRLGEPNGGISERVNVVVKLMCDSAIRCESLENLRKGRWEKLLWNIPFNGLGALLDRSTAQLLAPADGMALVKSVMEEVRMAAKADGIELSAAAAQHQIDRTWSMGEYQTSMQIDRRAGRPMEIEAIIGAVAVLAEQHKIAVPQLRMLLNLLRLQQSNNLHGK